jgi:SAM-dependent methyltransferase
VGSVTGPRPDRVLDVAAGRGAFGRAFADVVAVDIAAGQLAGNPAAARVLADAARLPFRDDAFAVVGSAFGINHVEDPAGAVREMARVAPVVGVSTWLRPERPYAPKRIVYTALERRIGTSRTPVGRALDGLTDRVGSTEAVTRLLAAAGLAPHVEAVAVEIPWPGLDRYLDYRLGMPSTPEVADVAALRHEVAGAISALPVQELTWRPELVIGVGTR